MEYSALLVIVVAGLLSLEIYLKRGIMGRLKSASESQGETQYSPGRLNSDTRQTMRTNTIETSGAGVSSETFTETRERTETKTVDRQ